MTSVTDYIYIMVLHWSALSAFQLIFVDKLS